MYNTSSEIYTKKGIIMSANKGFKIQSLAICLALILVLVVQSSRAKSVAEQSPTAYGLKEQEEPMTLAKNRYLAVPSALTRFLLYNARLNDIQGAGNLGYKRSSSALDALTGVTLGKRSSSAELINLDPYLGRQFGAHYFPRMYDMRWVPLDENTYQSA